MNIKNSSGLSFNFLENGSVKHIKVNPIRISLKSATPFSKSGANIYLRKRTTPLEFKSLLGQASNSLFQIKDNAFIANGNWSGIEYTCVLKLSKKSLSWQWTIDIENTTGDLAELDLLYVQDVGLKPISSGLVNEYYVSQYLERLILDDNRFGKVICCRQNTKESVGNPWIIMACENAAASASTDGMQFLGKTFRETGIPEGLCQESLGGEYSGELSMMALQEKPFTLASNEKHKSIFIASYLPDHPAATSATDLQLLPDLMVEFQDEISSQNPEDFFAADKNIFNISPFLPVDDLNNEELTRFFSRERRHIETENGKLLSFFYDQNKYVMLRAKEILADRPHGHIMQAQAGYEADENIVSTTAYAFGVFNSHVTQGNTNFNIFLSVCTSQFNDMPETGQRIFVDIEGHKYLLGIPSAFEMGLNHCRWIYKFGEHLFQVRSWTSKTSARVNLDFKVLNGKKVKLFVTHHFDESNGWTVIPSSTPGEFISKPKTGSMIAEKFPQAQFRIVVNTYSDYKVSGDEALYSRYKSPGNSFFILEINETNDFCMSLIGEVCTTINIDKLENADNQFNIDCLDAQTGLNDMSLSLTLKGNEDDTQAIQEILPWYCMNAITHFLTPHGLEQFGGAAWGTRDVSQGPFDLLLCLQKYDEAKKVLLTIFSNQNTTGDWPQWWMFDSYFTIRAGDCHGDVYYWCIIALSSYIKVTGDVKILDEVLPYFHKEGVAFAEKTPLSEHIDRLNKMIVNSFIPGTALVSFGGGDWNDSLQPVSKELAERMISSWTIEMNYQAFNEYKHMYSQAGNTEKAKELDEICIRIKSDFNKYLVKDGVVAGYGLVEKDGSISVLLHPSDITTGIHYSLLPMDRGVISGIFTKEQAQYHQQLIEKHLKGPDGARLMDRPLKYKGGIQTIFQRAESATHFGREIGIMYVHEHIRYAESQAITGNADAFVKALRQANPVGYRKVVPCGDIRQSNCYYSSSDVAFKSRYEADERYDEIKTGKITLRGGWRVYSSGPGIYITLIISRLLGLRIESGKIIIDPVIPHSMDGLSASLDFLGHQVTFSYSIREGNFSPKAISVNGKAITFTYEENKYRKGGAVIPSSQFLSLLKQKDNIVDISI
ncbi:MAG: amylo-alpha-1,6-glucosidase [Bacteroidales bacterium]|nr:amylo-alpha-1,6-glucosidase [Bacteroidales bacterium]